jgi:hypothetical protein
MAAIQVKRQVSELSTLIGHNVVIRSNVDNSEKRGTIIAYDASKNAIQVDQNKSHFWQSCVTGRDNVYIFTYVN